MLIVMNSTSLLEKVFLVERYAHAHDGGSPGFVVFDGKSFLLFGVLFSEWMAISLQLELYDRLVSLKVFKFVVVLALNLSF